MFYILKQQKTLNKKNKNKYKKTILKSKIKIIFNNKK